MFHNQLHCTNTVAQPQVTVNRRCNHQKMDECVNPFTTLHSNALIAYVWNVWQMFLFLYSSISDDVASVLLNISRRSSRFTWNRSTFIAGMLTARHDWIISFAKCEASEIKLEIRSKSDYIIYSFISSKNMRPLWMMITAKMLFRQWFLLLDSVEPNILQSLISEYFWTFWSSKCFIYDVALNRNIPSNFLPRSCHVTQSNLSSLVANNVKVVPYQCWFYSVDCHSHRMLCAELIQRMISRDCEYVNLPAC